MGSAATILAGCTEGPSEVVDDAYVNPDGYVGNTSPPYDTAPRDTPEDTVLNFDGPVGNTSAPWDTAIPDTTDSEPDASFGDSPADGAGDTKDDG